MLGNNFVHQTVGFGLFGGHDEIAFDIALDFLDRLAGVGREQ